MTLHIFFFFNDTATTEIYTLSLHDALPISERVVKEVNARMKFLLDVGLDYLTLNRSAGTLEQELHRSEEHTSELQSRLHLVCRLLLEKKKKKEIYAST